MLTSICNDWEFIRVCNDEFLKDINYTSDDIEHVRLPHTVSELPLQYADPDLYQTVSGYRRLIRVSYDQSKCYRIRFDGAAHIAEVFVNGVQLCKHACGYTSFTVDISGYLTSGECLLSVRLDSSENPEIPPFGFVIDYLTFGGIYRPVWLEELPKLHIEDIFVCTNTLDSADVTVEIAVPKGYNASELDGSTLSYSADNGLIINSSAVGLHTDNDMPSGLETIKFNRENRFYTYYLIKDIVSLDKVHTWSTDDPFLYTMDIAFKDRHGSLIDSASVRFGVRTATFKADGFYLNGQKTFLRGLNRHQCYPYVGYAATKSLQRLDAEILKNELRVNAVRTSHYPQSQDFIDACDELGLLVFTEIPGWQHIGDDPSWRRQAIQNTEEMIKQYRNHPSIILWGVRINESVDCDELYIETNRIAHALDPSRATSGVRYLEKSHLLEDVYAFNDFSYAGEGLAAKKRSRVSKNPDKAFLISECNGHMFPTKPWDNWLRREEHALRHAQVMNDAMADGEHAGCFEWCMFDYPTHKDFGSGDRVCYHGVMDYFRNPKLAASVYSSQGDIDEAHPPVLDISSTMDIGDYNAGRLEKAYVFTNADKVRLYKNGAFVTELKPSAFAALPHGPLKVDDTIGELLTSEEGFTGRKAKLLHKALNAAAQYGIAGLPLPDLLRMGWCMLRYRLTYDDGVRLFGKYVGNWGGEAVIWRYEAIKDGRVIAVREVSPGTRLHLEVSDKQLTMTEKDTYDMALVRIRFMDERGTPAVYVTTPVHFSLTDENGNELAKESAPIAIVGPAVTASQGGAAGVILKTCGRAGTAVLKIWTDCTEPVTIPVSIYSNNN